MIFAEDAESVDLARLGPLAEHSLRLFRNGSIFQLSHERRLSACVSGNVELASPWLVAAAPVLLVHARREFGGSSNRIIMDGGSVQIDWEQPEDVSQEASGDQGHVIMTGPVAHVARGTLSNDLASLLAGGDGGDSS